MFLVNGDLFVYYYYFAYIHDHWPLKREIFAARQLSHFPRPPHLFAANDGSHNQSRRHYSSHNSNERHFEPWIAPSPRHRYYWYVVRPRQPRARAGRHPTVWRTRAVSQDHVDRQRRLRRWCVGITSYIVRGIRKLALSGFVLDVRWRVLSEAVPRPSAVTGHHGYVGNVVRSSWVEK